MVRIYTGQEVGGAYGVGTKEGKWRKSKNTEIVGKQ